MLCQYTPPGISPFPRDFFLGSAGVLLRLADFSGTHFQRSKNEPAAMQQARKMHDQRASREDRYLRTISATLKTMA